MPQANIFGTIRDINGLSVKNASIIFNLMEAGAASEGMVVPSIPITTYTDDVGFFSVSVFANGAESGFPRYKVELVEGSKILDTYFIKVPALRTEYNLSELISFEQGTRRMPDAPTATKEYVDAKVSTSIVVSNSYADNKVAAQSAVYAQIIESNKNAANIKISALNANSILSGPSKASIPFLAGTFEDFGTRQVGSIDYVGAFRNLGNANAVIENGVLKSGSGFSNKDIDVVMNRKFSEGFIRVLVSRSNPNFLVKFRLSEDRNNCLAFWSADGHIEFGSITFNPGCFVTSFGNFGNIPNEDFWVELQCLAAYTGSPVPVRIWGKSQTRPNIATSNYTLKDADPKLKEGNITLSSIDGNVAFYQKLEIEDGAVYPNEQEAQATFLGRWFHKQEFGRNIMLTTAQGSECRFVSRGTDKVTVEFCNNPSVTISSVIAVSINNGAYTRITVPLGNFSNVDVATGLDPALTYTIKIVAAGINEYDDHWFIGVGLGISRFFAYSGSITPWIDNNRRIVMGIGDSITAGIVVGGLVNGGSHPSTSYGESNYFHLLCDKLNALPLQNGYGGTGVTVSGGGNIPKALDNYQSYMYLRPTHYLSTPDVIYINHGTNDKGRNVTSADFATGYRSLIDNIKIDFPNAKIICVTPFNGSYNREIKQVAAEKNVYHIDTYGYGITFADGTHPDQNGSNTGANRLYADTVNLLGVNFFN